MNWKKYTDMDIEEEIPKFDIPTDYIVGDNITGEILNLYGKFPCKIKAGIFALCVRGTIRATVNLAEFTICENDFVTLIPNTFIQIHEVSDDALLYFVGFSSHFVNSFNFIKGTMDFRSVIVENPIVPLSPEILPIYRDAIALLARADSSPDAILSNEIMGPVMDIFIHGIAGIYKQGTQWKKTAPTRENEISREFIQLVLQYYTREHSVSFYADKMGITLPHFCSTIKNATGQTALEIISGVIIMDAKAQLKSTNLPIKDISISLGFNNPSFFNKYFKQHVGMTPQEYRNE